MSNTSEFVRFDLFQTFSFSLLVCSLCHYLFISIFSQFSMFSFISVDHSILYHFILFLFCLSQSLLQSHCLFSYVFVLTFSSLSFSSNMVWNHNMGTPPNSEQTVPASILTAVTVVRHLGFTMTIHLARPSLTPMRLNHGSQTFWPHIHQTAKAVANFKC